MNPPLYRVLMEYFISEAKDIRMILLCIVYHAVYLIPYDIRLLLFKMERATS